MFTLFKRLVVFSAAVIVLLFVVINALAFVEPDTLKAPTPKSLVITHVNVVDPNGAGTIRSNQMIIIEAQAIRYVGDDGSGAMPTDAHVVDGSGQYAIPGLIDAHVHTLRLSPQLHFPLLIANGVTSIRDMGDSCSWSDDLDCQPDVALWREQQKSGAMVAPRILQSVSFHLEDESIDVAMVEQRIALVQKRAEPFLKIQLDNQITPQEFGKLIDISKAHQVALAGHVPFSIDLLAFDNPLRSIEHDVNLLAQCSTTRPEFNGRNQTKPALLQGIGGSHCAQLLAQLAKWQTVYVPTHVAASGQDLAFAKAAFSVADAQWMQRYLVAPQRWFWQFLQNAGREGPAEQQVLADFHKAALALTQQAQQAGVPVLAGTDALDTGVMHGFSLHQELQYLVAAGLSPAEALYAATLAPAKAFGVSSTLGSIANGKQADIVLLSANPLLDIRNTEKISAVIADGRLYDPAEREQALHYVEQQAHQFTMMARFLRGLWY